MFRWSGGFGLLDHHAIASSGRNILGQLAAHRAHILDDLPDLEFRYFSRERGHAIGTAFDDTCKNILRVASVNPIRIHQRWPDSATSVEVTAAAVVPTVETLPFVYGISALGIDIRDRRRAGQSCRMQFAYADSLRGG